MYLWVALSMSPEWDAIVNNRKSHPIISKGVLPDIAARIYGGFLYFQNTTRF
jgi:hypothetical protein